MRVLVFGLLIGLAYCTAAISLDLLCGVEAAALFTVTFVVAGLLTAVARASHKPAV